MSERWLCKLWAVSMAAFLMGVTLIMHIAAKSTITATVAFTAIAAVMAAAWLALTLRCDDDDHA